MSCRTVENSGKEVNKFTCIGEKITGQFSSGTWSFMQEAALPGNKNIVSSENDLRMYLASVFRVCGSGLHPATAPGCLPELTRPKPSIE